VTSTWWRGRKGHWCRVDTRRILRNSATGRRSNQDMARPTATFVNGEKIAARAAAPRRSNLVRHVDHQRWSRPMGKDGPISSGGRGRGRRYRREGAQKRQDTGGRAMSGSDERSAARHPQLLSTSPRQVRRVHRPQTASRCRQDRISAKGAIYFAHQRDTAVQPAEGGRFYRMLTWLTGNVRARASVEAGR